jgi:hypothetical protein
VPGHEGIVGNEMVVQLARTGSEPACGISIGVSKRMVRYWVNRNRKNTGKQQLDSDRQRDLH